MEDRLSSKEIEQAIKRLAGVAKELNQQKVTSLIMVAQTEDGDVDNLVIGDPFQIIGALEINKKKIINQELQKIESQDVSNDFLKGLLGGFTDDDN